MLRFKNIILMSLFLLAVYALVEEADRPKAIATMMLGTSIVLTQSRDRE